MLSQYSELNQKFKEFVQISEEISQISKTNEENCQNARNTIFEQSDQILTLERINDGLKNDVNSKDDRIRELEALLALKDAELGKKSEIGSEIGSEIENGQNGQKIKEKDDEILKLKNENENLLQQIEQININNEASLNQLNLLNFDKTQEELDKLQNTCAELQNMMAAKETENKIQIESIISQNEDKIKQFIDTSNDLNDKLDNITIVLEEEREKNHNLTQKVQNYENDFEHKNEQHQAYIDKLRLKKSQYKTQAFRISREATSLQEDMISKLELIDQLELQCNEFEIKIKSLEDHFVQNEDQIQILKHKNEQFDSQLKTKQNEYSSLQTQLDQLNERDRLVFAEFFALGLISSDDFETAMNKATQKE
jgi:chromosome segregation ATPase